MLPITCLFGDYRGKPGKCDLAPLRGRRCLLIADTDTRDRNAVLAIRLQSRLCLPDGEGGYGVADAIAEGGYRNMIAWIRKAGIRWFRYGPTLPAVAAIPSGRAVGRQSRRTLHCRLRREAPGSSHCCFDPRNRRLGGMGIPAGEAQALPGPGDVRAQGSKTERTTQRAPVCADRHPQKP